MKKMSYKSYVSHSLSPIKSEYVSSFVTNFNDVEYFKISLTESINGFSNESTNDCNNIPEQRIPVKIDETPMKKITIFSDLFFTELAEVHPNERPKVLTGIYCNSLLHVLDEFNFRIRSRMITKQIIEAHQILNKGES